MLFWRMIGDLIMRAAFIFAGVALSEKFYSTIYVFGAILIFRLYKMITQKEVIIESKKIPCKNYSVKQCLLAMICMSEKFL
ncbi:TerC family protein [Flavobacterium sp. DSR3-2]|uniref:TerC family protein n=1 Tax=Flavobacterium sp. DSR3-2 TaxID=2804634 RepID=UPI003CEF2905